MLAVDIFYQVMEKLMFDSKMKIEQKRMALEDRYKVDSVFHDFTVSNPNIRSFYTNRATTSTLEL